MVVAALVFEAGICRDDPNRLLAYPIRQLLFWYDLCVAWRKAMAKEQDKQAQQARLPAAPVTRPRPL